MAIKRITIFILLIALNGLLFGTAVCIGNNNIFNDRHWIDYKANLQLGLQDATSALVGRLILSGGNMHLGVYHGYQTMFSRHTEKIDRIDLKFRFGPNAFFDTVIGGAPPSSAGVRFSDTSIMPGQVYTVGTDGKFITHKKNARLDLASGRHLASFRQNGPDIDVWIDSKKTLTLPNVTLQPQFELRGSHAEIMLSSVKTYFKNRLVWQDHFFFPTSWQIIFRGCLALAAGLGLALFLIAFIFIKRPSKTTKIANRALGLILLFQALWLSFDFFYYAHVAVVSPRWSTQAYKPTVKYLNFERWRAHYFSALGEWLGADTAFTVEKSQKLGYLYQFSHLEPYTICQEGRCQWGKNISTVPAKKPGELRILILGGSEFQGVGTVFIDEAFFPQLYYKIHSKAASLPIQAFDIASWRDTPRQQVAAAIRLFNVIDPDVVVAGFIPYHQLTLQNRRLLEFLSTKNVGTIFVQGPTDFTERCDSCFETIKKIYANFGQEFIPVKLLIDNDLEQSGFLWMDSYHLAGYANSVVADIIAPVVLKKLKARSSGKSRGHAPHRTDGSPSKKTDTHER